MYQLLTKIHSNKRQNCESGRITRIREKETTYLNIYAYFNNLFQNYVCLKFHVSIENSEFSIISEKNVFSPSIFKRID